MKINVYTGNDGSPRVTVEGDGDSAEDVAKAYRATMITLAKLAKEEKE